MEIKILDSVTLNMLEEIKEYAKSQNTSDRETENTKIEFTGEYGFYLIDIKANEDEVESLTFRAVDIEHLTEANRLKFYMLENDFSQVELANRLGITKQALQQFLTYKRPVPKAIMEKIPY